MFLKKKVTISGSFTRHMKEIGCSMETFKDRGFDILSPYSVDLVKQVDKFLYVNGDIIDNIRLTQDKHLIAIAKSDFLWLVAPDGVVGQSACLEVGYAIAMNKKIYTKDKILDPTLIEYTVKVNNIDAAISDFKASKKLWDIKGLKTGLIKMYRYVAAIVNAMKAKENLCTLKP